MKKETKRLIHNKTNRKSYKWRGEILLKKRKAAKRLEIAKKVKKE